MLNHMTSRAGLTACTALIAVGLVAYTPLGQGLLNPGNFNENAIPTGTRAGLDKSEAELRAEIAERTERFIAAEEARLTPTTPSQNTDESRRALAAELSERLAKSAQTQTDDLPAPAPARDQADTEITEFAAGGLLQRASKRYSTGRCDRRRGAYL